MVLKMNKPDVERDTCTMLDEIKMMSHLSHENVIRCIFFQVNFFLVIPSSTSPWHGVVNMGFDFVHASQKDFFSLQISWNLRR